MNNLIFLGATLFITSCASSVSESETDTTHIVQEKIVLTKADSVIHACIETHGGDLYKKAHYSFNLDEKYSNLILMGLTMFSPLKGQMNWVVTM